MTGLDDFFATPRKAKSTPNISNITPIKEKNSITETVTSRPEKTEINTQVKERYKATPKNLRTYPERTYDKFATKTIQLREEDWDILRVLTSEIREAKKNINPELRANKRITENTIIRLLIQNFSESLEKNINNCDYQGIQTEEEVKNFINQTLQF